jgi:SAM-dependent methyltransferase
MTDTGKEQILSHIQDDTKRDITKIFKRVDADKEFEFIFFSKRGHQMNKEKYILLLKYMKNVSKNKKIRLLPPERTLDISYNATNISNNNNENDNLSSEGDKNTNNGETPLSRETTTGKEGPPGREVDKSIVYRVTVEGSDAINKLLNKLQDIQNKNYIIYKFLLHTLKKESGGENNEEIKFMVKTREPGDTIDVDDISIRVRLSSENNLLKSLRSKNPVNIQLDQRLNKLLTDSVIDIDTRKILNDNIIYRLKERTSLLVEENDNYFIRIDLTDTKTLHNIRRLNTTISNYELEIEYGVKNSKFVKESHLDTIYVTAENILKLLQGSKFIIGNTQTEKVIKYYREMTNVDPTLNNLVARQAVSLEIQHVTEILPNKYAVTDKADGDRCFLVIYERSVYIINTNMVVKDTGMILDKSLEQYNGTILDGEYVYLPRERRHLFMVFDCLRNGTIDVRSVTNFMQRLENADEIIEKCFIMKGQTGFKFKNAPLQKNEFDEEKIASFYGLELERFYEMLNKDIEHFKEYPLIRRKFFMPVFGAKRWEIFKYSVEFWSKYTEAANVKFPYLLDGLIYHPLEQPYITNVHESKYLEYKWKPPNKNSIDFYIEFRKDPQTGRIQNIYDNSLSSDVMDISGDVGTVRNKIYRICTLYVGKMVNNREHPVPFEQNYGVTEAYIYLKENELRDLSGDIISDKTVVEFYYMNDPDIIPQCRWVPIKTRYEKTESVEKFGRRYGNYSGTAERIWRSIINPVVMDDFIELSKGNTDKRNFYDIKIKEMNSKISHQMIVAVNKENKYYQKVTKIAATMRQYHNFIKSNLIYTFCNKMYQSNTQQSVLDIGFGRGGDIGKFYYTEVAFLVGIDIDVEGFRSPVNGAISRYNAFRKKKPNFPKMYFIQADARAILDYDSQVKCLSGMDDVNKKLLEKFFPTVTENMHHTLFDRIDCQFAMHYFLKDDLSWNNFKQNISSHLRRGGYFIATTFDAREVIKLIGDKDAYTVYYDDLDGNKKKFFEIVKRYDIENKDEKIGPGYGIDVFMSWAFDEGNFQTEYLVDVNFIKDDLANADFELVDTDLFSNQMEIHKDFLLDATKYESSKESRDYMAKVSQYYEKNEMNSKCIEYTNLHRYFIFRKKVLTDSDGKTTNTKEKSKQESKQEPKQKQKGKTQEGGEKDKHSKELLMEKYNFSDVSQFKIPDMVNYDNQYSMINSIHKLLVSHSIFPKSVQVDEFMNDLNMKAVKDHNLTDEYIKNLTKNMVINHEIVNDDGKSVVQNVLNGLNCIFVERDCNNFYDITYTLSNKSNKTKDTSSTRSIILMKEGGLYKPLMRKDDKGIKGIFKLKDKMIEYLIANGEEI